MEFVTQEPFIMSKPDKRCSIVGNIMPEDREQILQLARSLLLVCNEFKTLSTSSAGLFVFSQLRIQQSGWIKDCDIGYKIYAILEKEESNIYLSAESLEHDNSHIKIVGAREPVQQTIKELLQSDIFILAKPGLNQCDCLILERLLQLQNKTVLVVGKRQTVIFQTSEPADALRLIDVSLHFSGG